MKKIIFCILFCIIMLCGCSDNEDALAADSKTVTTSNTTIETTFAAAEVSSSLSTTTSSTNTASKTTSQATTTTASTTSEILQEEIIIIEEEEVPQIETIVFKPSTHYVHRSTCKWVTDECYEITNTNDIEARKCNECNPDIEIVNKYKEKTTTTKTSSSEVQVIDEYSYQLLAEIVYHEAGSSWITQYNKAKIAAGVMNRVKDSRFPNTVYDVLTQPGQFSGYYPNCCTPTKECYDAVDYYFSHTDEFNEDNSWWGDGTQNHFYFQ